MPHGALEAQPGGLVADSRLQSIGRRRFSLSHPDRRRRPREHHDRGGSARAAVRVFDRVAHVLPRHHRVVPCDHASRFQGRLRSHQTSAHHNGTRLRPRNGKRADTSRRCRLLEHKAEFRSCSRNQVSSVVGSIISPTPFPAYPPAIAPTVAPIAAPMGPATAPLAAPPAAPSTAAPTPVSIGCEPGAFRDRIGITPARRRKIDLLLRINLG